MKAASCRSLRGALLAAAVLAAALSGPTPAPADSLWLRREHRNAYLFEDNRGRRIGDNLTIAINELSNIGNNEQRTLDKATTFATLFNFKGSSAAGQGVSRSGSANLDLNGSAERTLKGQAQYTSTRNFTDLMTVTVIDLLPNGNLVVEGFRTRLVAGEERTLRVTGVVRPADIGAQNTVQSQFVAAFQITYVGKGPDTAFTRHGWFGRALNIIWPF